MNYKRSFKKLIKYENDADTIFDQSIAELFDNEDDAIELIKIKEVLVSLETATDKCEDVANVLETLFVSAAAYSLGHGTNDAQKTMGIITTLLVTTGYLSTFEVPTWVILSCHAAIALGTLFGGWRIVKTMGQKITKLKPSGGFAAEAAGAITLLVTAFSGIAVSTTHVINGAIMGVGATKRFFAVRWGLAGNIIFAWIVTIPASAAIGALSYWIVTLFK